MPYNWGKQAPESAINWSVAFLETWAVYSVDYYLISDLSNNGNGLLWEQEVAGSIPATPTIKQSNSDGREVIMAVRETYSKRKRRLENAGQPVLYQYDDLPEAFRVQVVHIWNDAIGHPENVRSRQIETIWDIIHNDLAREMGVFNLSDRIKEAFGDHYDQCVAFILTASLDDALDLLQISFGMIANLYTLLRTTRMNIKSQYEISLSPDEAIKELNDRFQEHQIGYKFDAAAGRIRRIDSEYLEAEATEPALKLLYEAGFEGPSDEFMSGHEHYRHGRNREAIADALKAFESTMKAICDARGWAYHPNATAAPLIEVVIKEGLVPKYLQQEFSALQSTLQSGLPTVRNRAGGHGQGAQVVDVPDHVAAYALNLAATNIVFLVELHKALS